MIDESIKRVLNKRNDLDFKPLYDLMEKSGLTFINQKLRQVMGIATFDAIYLDMEKFEQYTSESRYFVILHEMAHGLRIKKLGKAWLIGRLSLPEFDEFANAVIHEEIIADRYACRMIYRLIKYNYPRQATQQLHLPANQNYYKNIICGLFGKVQNNEENYNKLFETYLIKN